MSDGVIKLTAYLNQTRRQAELAIDVLNQKISELIKDNEELNNTLNNVFEERDHFKSIADKLKVSISNQTHIFSHPPLQTVV